MRRSARAQNVPNVVTYDAVIDVSNPDQTLLPGMTANVTIATAEQDDTLKVPNAALRFQPGRWNLRPRLLPAFGRSAAPSAERWDGLGSRQRREAPTLGARPLAIRDGTVRPITAQWLQPEVRCWLRGRWHDTGRGHPTA